MMFIQLCLMSVLVKRLTDAVVMVDRQGDGRDIFSRNKSITCEAMQAQFQSETTCKCNNDARTFGSNNPPCTSFAKCDVLDGGVILVKGNITSRKVMSNFKTNCYVEAIQIWNIPSYVNNEGIWVDVTKFSLKYFNISGKVLSIHLPFEHWQGQLIKIIFACNNDCAILKVRGKITYPFVTSMLDPKKTRKTPLCIINCPGEEDQEEPDSVGYIITAVVVSIILIVITIVLVRVCRHKIPCWKYEPPIMECDDDDDMNNSSCCKGNSSEYEELIVTSLDTTQPSGSAEQDRGMHETIDCGNQDDGDPGEISSIVTCA